MISWTPFAAVPGVFVDLRRVDQSRPVLRAGTASVRSGHSLAPAALFFVWCFVDVLRPTS